MHIIDHREGRVPGPGFYRMPAHVYLADPAPEPSLSSSIARTLVLETPVHAWHAHPRLNPEFVPDDVGAAGSVGAIAHRFLLGRGADFESVDADDWRTKAAKEQRERIVADGKTPLLLKQEVAAETIASAIGRAIASMPELADFEHPDARSEVVMVWQDPRGAWCRAMIDRLAPSGRVFDIKTTGRGLADKTLQNRFDDGFAVQPGFYLRGLEALWPEMAGRFRWTWIFAEQVEPFAVRAEEAGPFALKMGEEQVDYALRLWERCCRFNAWPGYSRRVGRLDPTEWAYQRWTERVDAESHPAAAPSEVEPEADSLIFGETRLYFPESA